MYASMMVSLGATHGTGLASWAAGLALPFSLVCLLFPSCGPSERNCFIQRRLCYSLSLLCPEMCLPYRTPKLPLLAAFNYLSL